MRLFVGTGPCMEPAERALENSIRANTSTEVQIHWMRAHECALWSGWLGSPTAEQVATKGFWATPFSLFRYAIPAACHFQGQAIYLDVDMVVLGDLCELAQYGKPGRWAHADNRGGDCVSVIDCEAMKGDPGWPTIQDLKSGALDKNQLRSIAGRYMKPLIPPEWNVKDDWRPEAKLIHFTGMATQPWKPYPDRIEYKEHPCPQAVEIFEDYAGDSLRRTDRMAG